jgi:hypothetical protein
VLTEGQVESVREITEEPSSTVVAAACALLNPSQEAATIADIAEFSAIRSKFLKIGGGKAGISLDYDETRKGIQRRVRLRLGLPAIPLNAFGTSGGPRPTSFSSTEGGRCR